MHFFAEHPAGMQEKNFSSHDHMYHDMEVTFRDRWSDYRSLFMCDFPSIFTQPSLLGCEALVIKQPFLQYFHYSIHNLESTYPSQNIGNAMIHIFLHTFLVNLDISPSLKYYVRYPSSIKYGLWMVPIYTNSRGHKNIELVNTALYQNGSCGHIHLPICVKNFRKFCLQS